MRLRYGLGLLLAFSSACGGSGGTGDAATGDAATDAASDAGDASALCSVDSDCDDGLFCNGAESCAPSDALADAKGCAPAEDPCLAEQTCDEGERRCLTDCDVSGDADGDGHDSIDCGGDDCDDADPNRFPGNTEVCDMAKHDEDCDPTTFGFRDMDMDGFPDDACCNVDASGVNVCGTDCEDSMPGVHPTEAESCNDIDDNCDGMIDEGLMPEPYYPDCDGDGFGAVGSTGVVGCRAPAMTPSCSAPSSLSKWVPNERDCDDSATAVNPLTVEACNGIDDNCDGLLGPDEDFDHDGQLSLDCGGTDCNDHDDQVYAGAPELCDLIDSDCSLAGAAAGGADPAEDADGDGHAPIGATCSGVRPKDDCDDTVGSGSAVHPGAAEVCNGIDDDCDGTIDGSAAATACPSRAHVVTATCASGSCSALVCESGWDDCDTLETNGCEHDVTSDSLNCGSCGLVCHISTCTAGDCDEAVAVNAGGWHTCARRASGRVVCWGDNRVGAVGDGTTLERNRPVLVGGSSATLSGALQVSAGANHTCAVLSAGQVVCWGDNTDGQIGDDTTARHLLPTSVIGLPVPAVEVSAGGSHTCARLSDGEVYCWGSNARGQLGTGTFTRWRKPTIPVLGVSAVEIRSGSQHSCARDSTGEVTCWGADSWGQIGDGGGGNVNSPVTVPGLTDAVELALGDTHSCARRATGAVVCWGDNRHGQLGDGTTAGGTIVNVSGLTDAVAITAGGDYTCARRRSGQIVCWGDNTFGQLGDGTLTERHTPTDVAGLTDAISIDAGFTHTCAVRASGQIVCWGGNNYAQLGDLTTTDRTAPTNVSPM